MKIIEHVGHDEEHAKKFHLLVIQFLTSLILTTERDRNLTVNVNPSCLFLRSYRESRINFIREKHTHKLQLLIYFLLFLKAPEPEDIMADIVFLIDSSSSVTSINFRHEKKFVNAMARSLNASPDKSRTSVIVYGSTNDVVLSLEEFTNLDDFKLAVDSAKYIDGPRRMDLALDAAATVMNRTRRNLAKIVVLLTSGMQSPTNTPDPLGNAVRPLRNLGVQTFVVSIGSGPDKRELASLVDHPRDIFNVPSFEALLPQTIPITKSIAERSGEIGFFLLN